MTLGWRRRVNSDTGIEAANAGVFAGTAENSPEVGPIGTRLIR